MRREAVPWRYVFVALALLGVVVGSVVLIVRSAGFDAVDAQSTHATRWFVDKSSDRVVLVDGYSGRALARLQPSGDTIVDDVVQGGGQATVLDRNARVTRSIDGAALKLGPSQPLPLLSDPATIVGVGSSGVVAVDPAQTVATIVPAGGTPIRVDLASDSNPANTRIAPDGSIWTLLEGILTRTTATESATVMTGLEFGSFSLVGNTPLMVDRAGSRWRFGDGVWVPIPQDVQVGDLVLQEPSPESGCGWAGVDGQLYCIGSEGIEEQASIDGLDIDGGDLLAIAGDAAVVVDRSAAIIRRLDWRSGTVIEARQTDLDGTRGLRVATSVDLVWVDTTYGGTVWAVNPWGMNSIEKDDATTPLVGEDGETISAGETAPGNGTDGVAAADGDTQQRQPDGNETDDPPVAVDDSVSARSGMTVPVNVTANDYDPDGEAVVVVATTAPSNGSVIIASASTVSYQPTIGFVGKDTFEYTIVDGNGSEATATVTIDLLSPDAPNQAPVGAPDLAQTGPEKPVIIDVLLNDVDPERDALRISNFTADVSAGSVREVTAPSGLPGLQFSPGPRFFGRASLTYTPMDALGAVGGPVEVFVDVASPGTENRPPITKPDAIRVRRGVPSQLAVLANDIDPDGDTLSLELVEPLPESVEVSADGDVLEITARAGSEPLVPIQYRAVDPAGLDATGSVLVSVITEAEPNRPPTANADTATAVAGSSTVIDVLRNDTDPDGDPIRLVSARSAGNAGTVTVDGDQVVYQAAELTDSDNVLDRAEYTISDGNGHEVDGTISVRIIPESLPEPPVALDDSVTTEQDTPVVIDALANDSDPSGGSLAIVGDPGCPSGGEATVTSDQLLRYTPPTGRSGVFNCSYEVANASGLRSVATIKISVVRKTVTNRPPLVISEERTVRVNESITVAVLDNDTDPDGNKADLKLLNSTEPTAGSAVRNPDGTISYTAPAAATVVSISYDVIDAEGAIASGRLVIRVIGEPKQPPSANPDLRFLEPPVTEVVVDALANDTDPDGSVDALKITALEVLSGSATAEQVDRKVRIVPAAGFVGEILTEYKIEDADGLTATAVITVRIAEVVNRPPTAGPDVASVAAGETVSVPIGLNDVDPDGDPLTFQLLEQPPARFGTATIANGELIFVADVAADGIATVRYAVSDGAFSAESVVTISIAGCVSAPPTAKDAFLETGYRQPISINLNRYAANGKVVDVSGAVSEPIATYTPPAGENGNVTVTFAVENACGDRDTAALTIDVNQDPVGSQYVIDLARDKTVRISVDQLASDDEPLSITELVRAPEWVTIVPGRKAIELTPGAASGRVNFSVLVTDPGGLQATVPVAATVKNSPPNAPEQTIYADRVDFDFTLMDVVSDPDGDAVRYLSLPSAVSFNDKSVRLRTLPNNRLRLDLTEIEGVASFTYSVQDEFGLASRQSIARVVTRWVAPVADDVNVRLAAGEEVTVDAKVSDADGQALRLGYRNPPPGGTLPYEVAPGLKVALNGLGFIVTAEDEVQAGEYSMDYVAVDTGGRSDWGTLKIEVEASSTTTTSVVARALEVVPREID